MANEYLIQNTTLTAIANAIRGKLGESSYTINEGLLGPEEGTLITPAVVSLVEYVDWDGNYSGLGPNEDTEDSFGWYGYANDNNGVPTLVLYKTDTTDQDIATSPDLEDLHFHMGRVEIDGVEYDKWRKIDANFTWDTEGKKYIYTNVITAAPTDAIGPLDMPAKIMSISGAEDLSAELTAQDELIADIKTAVASKAAGGGSGIETCTMEFDGDGGMYTGQMVFTTVENGSVTARFEIDFSTPATFTVVKNSFVYFSNGVPPNSGYAADVDGYEDSQSSGYCKITGDTEFYN